MSWAKIDDRFLMNPKVMSAGLEGRALYLAGILYCAGELTDGKVPAAAVRKLAALSDVEDADAAAQRLVGLNLWENDAATGGYIIHDYHDYNPTSHEAKQHKQDISLKRSEAGNKGMAKRWQSDNKNPSSDNKTITNALQADSKSITIREDNKTITPSPSPSPSPSQSYPVPEEEPALKKEQGARDGELETDLTPKPAKKKVSRENEGLRPAVHLFHTAFCLQKKRFPIRDPVMEARLSRIYDEQGEETFLRGLNNFFSCLEGRDTYPKREGYPMAVFVRQFDRWEGAENVPRVTFSNGSRPALSPEERRDRNTEWVTGGLL